MRMKQLSMAATYRDDMVVRMPKVLAIPSRYRAEELVLVFQCLNVYDLNNYLGTYHHDKLLFQLRPHKPS